MWPASQSFSHGYRATDRHPITGDLGQTGQQPGPENSSGGDALNRLCVVPESHRWRRDRGSTGDTGSGAANPIRAIALPGDEAGREATKAAPDG